MLDLDNLISISGLVLQVVESIVLFVEFVGLQRCDCRIRKIINYGCDCDFFFQFVKSVVLYYKVSIKSVLKLPSLESDLYTMVVTQVTMKF
jgi:hypothetical protein